MCCCQFHLLAEAIVATPAGTTILRTTPLSTVTTTTTTFIAFKLPHAYSKHKHILISFNTIQYKLKRCSNKECCKQCRYVKFKDTMSNWPGFETTIRVFHFETTLRPPTYGCRRMIL